MKLWEGDDLKMIEKTFSADDEVLRDVLGFVESELEKADCPMKVSMQIAIAVEEMFVNVAHYAYPEGNGDILLGMDVSEDFVTIVLTDSGIPFDPLGAEDPDITLSAEEREVGGLGIFMVKKTMDDVGYRFENGKNVFTIKKRIG